MNKERSDYMFGPPEIERPPSMKWCLRAHIHIALRERVNARILKWRDSFIAPVTIAHISDSGRRYYVSIRKEYRGYDWEVVKYDSGGEVIERQPPWSFSRTKELAIKDFMGSGWWNAKGCGGFIRNAWKDEHSLQYDWTKKSDSDSDSLPPPPCT